MRAVLLKGISRYDALRVFSDELAAAFRDSGIETVIADMVGIVTDQDILDRLAGIGRVDFGFSFNVLGHYTAPDGRSIGDIIGAPFVVQHVDYPLTHRSRLEQTAPSCAVLTVDPSHVELIEKLYGPQRYAAVAFNPHAAIGTPHPPAPTRDAFLAERPIPILFSGSWYGPGEPAWKAFPGFVPKLFDDAAELALSVEFMPALDAIDTVLNRMGGKGIADDPQFLPLRKAASLLHEWVRSTRRFQFFKTAAEVGLPLTVYGADFDKAAAQFTNIDWRGETRFGENVRLMQQARIVANINANFGRGSHERPFTAMVAGAAAMSDFSTYYADTFDEGHEIALYRWTHLAEDLAAMRELLADPQRLFDLAQAGHAKACREHCWSNRVAAIRAAAQTPAH